MHWEWHSEYELFRPVGSVFTLPDGASGQVINLAMAGRSHQNPSFTCPEAVTQ